MSRAKNLLVSRPQTTSAALCTCSENLGLRCAGRGGDACYVGGATALPLAGRAAGTKAKTLRLYRSRGLIVLNRLPRIQLGFCDGWTVSFLSWDHKSNSKTRHPAHSPARQLTSLRVVTIC